MGKLCGTDGSQMCIRDRVRPDAIAVEELFWGHNVTTGIGVSHGRGVILLAKMCIRDSVGGIDTILDSGAELSPELQRELLQNIREESHWLIGVVENLLSVTRVSGGASIQKELEAGEEVLSSAAMKLGRRYPDVQISVRAPEELLLIPMDAILIEQVLINLMENAIQHGQTTVSYTHLFAGRSAFLQ